MSAANKDPQRDAELVGRVSQRVSAYHDGFFETIESGGRPGSEPSATERLDRCRALIEPAEGSAESLAAALEDATYELVRLAEDAYGSLDRYDSIDDDWPQHIYDSVGDYDAEEGDPPETATLARDALDEIERIRPTAARYELSLSRGRPSRPVAPGIGGSMVRDALDAVGVIGARAVWSRTTAVRE
jgi:hypothetical protein